MHSGSTVRVTMDTAEWRDETSRDITGITKMPLPTDLQRIQQATRVWAWQRQPSARAVAKALTQTGTPVHFTTVARWKRKGWLAAESKGASSDQPNREPERSQLPTPVTPLEAKCVWDSQRRPSSRSVARALTERGRTVHFTTVARWKKERWCTNPLQEHPLSTALRMVDLAIPLLTDDPTTLAWDLLSGTQPKQVSDIADDNERLRNFARECLTIVIIAYRKIQCRSDEFIQNKPTELSALMRALGVLLVSACKTLRAANKAAVAGRHKVSGAKTPA